MASKQDSLPAAAAGNADKLTASCHCGRVAIELPAPPTKLNECHCSICYRYGAVWAYYPHREVQIVAKEPGLRSYVREDEAQGGKGTAGFYCCAHCNCMTHWLSKPEHAYPDNKMGVNTRMLPEIALFQVERRIGTE